MQKHIVPAILGAAIALTALTTTLRAVDTPIVAVGCVNRAAQNGSMTASAVAPPATPDTAGTIANNATLTNEFMLNGATTPNARATRHRSAAAIRRADRPAASVRHRAPRGRDPHRQARPIRLAAAP